MATKAPPPWCSFTKPLRCMDAPVAIEFASLKKKRLQCCKLALAAVHSFAKLCTQIESCNWALWRAEWRAVCIPHTKLGALARNGALCVFPTQNWALWRGMPRCVYSPHKIWRSGALPRCVYSPQKIWRSGALPRAPGETRGAQTQGREKCQTRFYIFFLGPDFFFKSKNKKYTALKKNIKVRKKNYKKFMAPQI